MYPVYFVTYLSGSDQPRGFAPRTPRQALSLAASPARSVHLARSRCSLASSNPDPGSRQVTNLSRGASPSASPTSALPLPSPPSPPSPWPPPSPLSPLAARLPDPAR